LTKAQKESELYLQEQKRLVAEKIEQITEQSRRAAKDEYRKIIKEAKSEIATLTILTTERLLHDILTDEIRTNLNERAAALLMQPGDNNEAQT
jgi:hypothetical protein